MNATTDRPALEDLRARLDGTYTDLDVRLDGVVVSRRLVAIPNDGEVVVIDTETDRMDWIAPTAVEAINASVCVSCGVDYADDVSDEDCDLRWTGGHALPVCSGCGDEVRPADAHRHLRCHLIP